LVAVWFVSRLSYVCVAPFGMPTKGGACEVGFWNLACYCIAPFFLRSNSWRRPRPCGSEWSVARFSSIYQRPILFAPRAFVFFFSVNNIVSDHVASGKSLILWVTSHRLGNGLKAAWSIQTEVRRLWKRKGAGLSGGKLEGRESV